MLTQPFALFLAATAGCSLLRIWSEAGTGLPSDRLDQCAHLRRYERSSRRVRSRSWVSIAISRSGSRKSQVSLKDIRFSDCPLPQQSEAGIAAFDEKLPKLGYQAKSDMPKGSCPKAPAPSGGATAKPQTCPQMAARGTAMRHRSELYRIYNTLFCGVSSQRGLEHENQRVSRFYSSFRAVAPGPDARRNNRSGGRCQPRCCGRVTRDSHQYQHQRDSSGEHQRAGTLHFCFGAAWRLQHQSRASGLQGRDQQQRRSPGAANGPPRFHARDRPGYRIRAGRGCGRPVAIFECHRGHRGRKQDHRGGSSQWPGVT